MKRGCSWERRGDESVKLPEKQRRQKKGIVIPRGCTVCERAIELWLAVCSGNVAFFITSDHTLRQTIILYCYRTSLRWTPTTFLRHRMMGFWPLPEDPLDLSDGPTLAIQTGQITMEEVCKGAVKSLKIEKTAEYDSIPHAEAWKEGDGFHSSACLCWSADSRSQERKGKERQVE